MEGDLECEFDSTWDSESSDGEESGGDGHLPAQPAKSWSSTFPSLQWPNSSSRNFRAAKDMQNYRHGYPNISEDECQDDKMTNLKFYLNEIPSSPDDVLIDVFHREWRTDYRRLERVHSYIQWLFPLREPGVNYLAAELTTKEIEAFRNNAEAKRRLADSYELMLGFYGIKLHNRETGEVRRAENWRDRFHNLERNMHNNLRITRILKSLGELGLEHYQAPLVQFFLEETLVKKNLSSVKRSVLDYFVFAVKDKSERQKLLGFAYQNYEPKDKFVWCPKRVQKLLKEGRPMAKSREKGHSEGSSVDPEPSGNGKDTEAMDNSDPTESMASEGEKELEEVKKEIDSPEENVPEHTPENSSNDAEAGKDHLVKDLHNGQLEISTSNGLTLDQTLGPSANTGFKMSPKEGETEEAVPDSTGNPTSDQTKEADAVDNPAAMEMVD